MVLSIGVENQEAEGLLPGGKYSCRRLQGGEAAGGDPGDAGDVGETGDLGEGAQKEAGEEGVGWQPCQPGDTCIDKSQVGNFAVQPPRVTKFLPSKVQKRSVAYG